MKITRKVSYNKRTNQASITLPRKVIKKMQDQLKVKHLEKINISISVKRGKK